jgi:hypothetical protein
MYGDSMYNQQPDFSGRLTFEKGKLIKVEEVVEDGYAEVSPEMPRGTFKGLTTITLLHTEGSAWCTVVFGGKCYTVQC